MCFFVISSLYQNHLSRFKYCNCFNYEDKLRLIVVIGGESSLYEETLNGTIFILPANKETQNPMELPFSEAKEWCTNSKAMLPRIIEDRDFIFHFIQKAISANTSNKGTNVLVNVIKHTVGNWSWINGRDVKGINVGMVSQVNNKINEEGLYDYGYLWTDGGYKIHASLPTVPRNYICEYSNLSLCNAIVGGKCYQKTEVRLTWFQAKEDCVRNKGDLASFETLNDTTLKVSLQNLFLNNSRDYWIGFRRTRHYFDNNGSEIKFINWTDNRQRNFLSPCLCLHKATQLEWVECECNKSKPFICTREVTVSAEANDPLTSVVTFETTASDQMTPSTDRPSTASVIISTDTITPTSALSTMISPLAIDQSPTNNKNAVIGAVVLCVIFVVFIIVVVVMVIIIRKRRQGPVNSSREESLESRTTPTRNEFPIYAQVQKPRGNKPEADNSWSADNTTYATVQQVSRTNEKSQDSNIVYAELDFPPRA